MSKHRLVTLVAVALLSVSFCASRLLGAEMSGIMMKDGKMMMMMKDGEGDRPHGARDDDGRRHQGDDGWHDGDERRERDAHEGRPGWMGR